MPRDPKVTTTQALAVAHANWKAAERAARTLAEKRRKAIVAAVAAGNSKAHVGRTAGITAARVAAICQE